MNVGTLDILRCPYCGGRLTLVTSMFHEADDDRISEGILGCHCCIFPVVDGIPVLHLQAAAVAARDHLEAARPDRALQTMVGLADEAEAARTYKLLEEMDQLTELNAPVVDEVSGPRYKQ